MRAFNGDPLQIEGDSMTILDIAQSMKGRLRDGLSKTQSGTQPGESEVAFGTAAADSSGGFVSIIMDGAPTDDPDYDPADYTFEVACDSPITAGDRVSYISDAGRGKAVSVATLTQIAQDADAIATATDQHFWADSGGVHVSTDEDDPAGAQNIVMNSAGVLLREGSDYLAAFTPSAVAFYDGNGNSASNITASFGSTGATIGSVDAAHMVQTPTAASWYSPDGSTEIASLGYDNESNPRLWLRSVRQRIVGMASTAGSWLNEILSIVSSSDTGSGTVKIEARGLDKNDPNTTLNANFLVTSESNTYIGNGLTVNPEEVNIQNRDLYASGKATIAGYLAALGGAKVSGGLEVYGTVTMHTALPITSGGSGQSGTSTDTAAAGIITAGTYITVTGASYSVWGKVAQLLVTFTRSSAISANQNFTVGTVASGKRPVHTAGGSSNSFTGWLTDTGTLTVRNVTGAQIAANTTVYISFTYLLP